MRMASRGLAVRSPFFWCALAAGLLIFMLQILAGTAIVRYGGTTYSPGWRAEIGEGSAGPATERRTAGVPNGSRTSSPDAAPREAAFRPEFRITAVDARGPAAGRLLPGDRLLTVDGRPISSRIGLLHAMHVLPDERPYPVGIERAGEHLEVRIPAGRPALPTARLPLFGSLLASLSWSAVALLLGMSRPELKTARLGSCSFFVFSILLLHNVLNPLRDQLPALMHTQFNLICLLFPFHLAFGYRFALNFPEPHAASRFWRLLGVLFTAAAVLWVPATLVRMAWLSQEVHGGFSALAAHYHFFSEYWQLGSISPVPVLIAAGLAATGAVLLRNYARTDTAEQRLRIKVAVAGGFAIALFMLVVSAATVLLQHLGLVRTDTFSMLHSFDLITLLFPLSLGYAVLKHRVLEIDVIVRRGVRYLLARNLLRAVIVLPLALMVVIGVMNPDLTLGQVFLEHPLYLVLMGVALAALRNRDRLGRWIDRRFFREAYNREHILLELVEAIRRADRLEAIARRAGEQLELALHPRTVLIIHRNLTGPGFRVSYVSSDHDEVGIDAELEEGLTRTPALQEESTLELPPGPLPGLPVAVSRWLEQLRVQLLVPMNGPDRSLVGLILLGERRSEAAYAPDDRKLLEAIAAQLAVVYENARLQAHLTRETRLRRDLQSRIDAPDSHLLLECARCGACAESPVERCPRDGEPLTLSLPIPRVIEGKYRLDWRIGRGGVGTVYAATDLRLDRLVAVKVMLTGALEDRSVGRRFTREAQTCARLNHPNIVSIHDFGTIEPDGAYLVMELLNGTTWRDELERTRRIDPAQLADWLEQVLAGIEAAHESGIIHRDLKPENLMVVREAAPPVRIKLLDFGLARALAGAPPDSSNLTMPGTLMGTFGYMAPEQLLGESVDERADLFALGVVTAEALTGERPFKRQTWAALLRSMDEVPFRLPEEGTEARTLEAVILRCLERDPAKRFSSVAELREALLPALRAYASRPAACLEPA